MILVHILSDDPYARYLFTIELDVQVVWIYIFNNLGSTRILSKECENAIKSGTFTEKKVTRLKI
jgi:hypothetical protein